MNHTSSAHQVNIITIDLSFHRAATGVVRAVLQKHGVATTEILAPHEHAFARFRDGEADILCSAWLPFSHDVYLRPFQDEIEKLTVLYRPYALWGVPDYVPEAAIRTIDDLKKPDVAARMIKHIQGIGPGAGISRFSREIVARHGLGEHGYQFHNGSLDDCVNAFEQAVRHKEWVVVPLWKPQFLHERYRVRELADPLGLLGGTDDATLIIRKDRLPTVPEQAIDALRGLTLGNDEVSRLDYLISREGIDPMRAALTSAAV